MSKQTTKPAAEAEAEVKDREAKAAAKDVMYLGPTIVGTVRHSTVYKNGVLTDKVKNCIKQFPAMQRLFVETDKLSDAVKELNKKQSALGTIYAQVAKKFI